MRVVALIVGLVLSSASVAFALPPIPAYLPEILDELGRPDFKKTLEGTKSKCDVCHKPGADKKAKGHGLNDFGEATHKHLKHKQFMADHKAEMKPAAAKLMKEAWEKAEAEKNAEGKPFGDLIKAGKLPGKND